MANGAGIDAARLTNIPIAVVAGVDTMGVNEVLPVAQGQVVEKLLAPSS